MVGVPVWVEVTVLVGVEVTVPVAALVAVFVGVPVMTGTGVLVGAAGELGLFLEGQPMTPIAKNAIKRPKPKNLWFMLETPFFKKFSQRPISDPNTHMTTQIFVIIQSVFTPLMT